MRLAAHAARVVGQDPELHRPSLRFGAFGVGSPLPADGSVAEEDSPVDAPDLSVDPGAIVG